MIYVFGHKNPDTDSVCSAIALSRLKNLCGDETSPCVLGTINKESSYVLEKYNVEVPEVLEDVKTQVMDLNYDKIDYISPDASIMKAYRIMEEDNIRTLPVCDEEGKLKGIVTMKDIAMGLIKGDFYHLKTSIDNICESLDGKYLTGENQEVSGNINVVALYHKTMVKEEVIDEESIIIVGDRYDAIEIAIRSNVQLIIITGGKELPEKLLVEANEKKIPILSVNGDTYTVSKQITLCNYVSSILKKSKIKKFRDFEYVEDIKEIMMESRYTHYPVIDKHYKYLGVLSRAHILSPNRKRVILVDHNEYSQSVDGLNEADILEVIDHHKIGDINTNLPISFRNVPVGSTCTIVYEMYKESGIQVEADMAGLLLSGIVSDTLYFKSPTTTERDKKAVEELNQILGLDIDNYVMEMFKKGTSLEDQSTSEIFFKDFKEFEVNGNVIGISQVFTLDIGEVFNRRVSFEQQISKIHEGKGYYLTLFLATDILNEGSYVLYKSEQDGVIKRAFGPEVEQASFVEGLVSRKKQVLPALLEAIYFFGS